MIDSSLSFDDILLVPRFSAIESRSMLTTQNNLDSSIELGLPIISSPMDTVTEVSMVSAMDSHGGLGIIHRYNSIQNQAGLVKFAKDAGSTNIGAAVGVTGDYQERAKELVDNGANVLCVDVAHGHHSMMRDALKHLKEEYGGDTHIMAGNVATGQGGIDLANWGLTVSVLALAGAQFVPRD